MIQRYWGERPLLPPHRADQHELRPPRGPRPGRRGGPGGPLRPPPAEPPAPSRPAWPRWASAYVTAEGHQLPQLNCVRIPDGVDDLAVRKRLLTDWGIEIGGGLGSFKGKAWRIGLMGHGSRRSNVTLVLAALETCLRDLGTQLEPGASLAAAGEVYGRARAVAVV